MARRLQLLAVPCIRRHNRGLRTRPSRPLAADLAMEHASESGPLAARGAPQAPPGTRDFVTLPALNVSVARRLQLPAVPFIRRHHRGLRTRPSRPLAADLAVKHASEGGPLGFAGSTRHAQLRDDSGPQCARSAAPPAPSRPIYSKYRRGRRTRPSRLLTADLAMEHASESTPRGFAGSTRHATSRHFQPQRACVHVSSDKRT